MSADEHQVYCPSWKHLPPEDNADDCGDSETKSQRRTTVGHKTRPAGHTHTRGLQTAQIAPPTGE